MSISDLRAFLQERLQAFDPSIDVSAGSSADMQIIQPLLQRLGPDPFSSDFATFALTKLQQEYPDMAIREGDAITDLVIKPFSVLLEPIVREITQVKKAQSLIDPTTLTVEEATALGANLIVSPRTGDTAKGTARLYFAQPQNISVTPSNFVTSKTGLHFFPTDIQSISTSEMLLNTEGSLYYFDISLVAEAAGSEYNIGKDELISIANIASAVRIFNSREFSSGLPAETAVEFIGRANQELSERSLVTLRGIAAKISNEYPDVTRLGVVGFGDSEMQRDVIEGGGFGPIRASGSAGVTLLDGDNKTYTRRIQLDANLYELLGPPGQDYSDWYLTVSDLSVQAGIHDFQVRTVVSDTILDLEEQVLSPPALGIEPTSWWTLRKKEVTLSSIPGGIVLPDESGNTSAKAVHVGGATDIVVRGDSTPARTLLIDVANDSNPILSGLELHLSGGGDIFLPEYTLNVTYTDVDPAYEAFSKAREYGLQILDDAGIVSGIYRVLHVHQVDGIPVIMTLYPSPPEPNGYQQMEFKWKLLDTLQVDLVEPKDIRVSGIDLKSIMGQDYVESALMTDFQVAGVSAGDVLRINNGPDKGDYSVLSVIGNFHTRVLLDRALGFSNSNLSYSIFRSNTDGGVERPVVRVTGVELLDTTKQATGIDIPYAKAIDARTTAFWNSGHGLEVDVTDGLLGLISIEIEPAGISGLSGTNLVIGDPGSTGFSVTFVAADPWTLDDIVARINEVAGRRLAYKIGKRFGILHLGVVTVLSGTAPVATLFEGVTASNQLRSPTATWPTVGKYSAVQTLDGADIGFYDITVREDDYLTTEHNFYPAEGVRVQVGTRSTGSARVYFLNPTSATFDYETKFFTESGLEYFVDKLDYRKLPPLPNGDPLTDGSTSGATFTSASSDFLKSGVVEGDHLVIKYIPNKGIVALTDPVPNLHTKNIILSINGGPNKSIALMHDSNSIAATAVTRKGVVDQINLAVGMEVCYLSDDNHLVFDADASIIIRKSGSANTDLGFTTLLDENNDAPDPNKGTYVIWSIDSPTQVTLRGLDGSTPSFLLWEQQRFDVISPNIQRIVSTSMANNVTSDGLYYFDVELVSKGVGDLWNIPAGTKLVGSGYKSDGYWLTTSDSNLSFSTEESLTLNLSRSIIELGASDDLRNAIQLSGQRLKVSYDASPLVGDVQAYISAETERVVNSSSLARHLTPHFVRMFVEYFSGASESDIQNDIESIIKALYPHESLRASAIQKLMSNRGATAITNPIELIALVHNRDRSIAVERSYDKLNTGRLAAFIPDVLSLVRRVG